MFRIGMILGLLLVLPSNSYAQEHDLALARLISDGYKQNRELLRSLRCKFTYVTGSAKSYECAITGDFKPDRTLICNWLTRGEFEKWETFPSLDGTASRIAEQQEVVFLRNAKTTLVYHPGYRTANLRPPSAEPWPDIFTPLNLMIMAHDERLSPQNCIQKALAGELVFKEISRKTIQDKPCYLLALFDSREAQANLITMTIDPAVGFLPVNLAISTPDSIVECRILETKRLPNGAWFPMSARLGIQQKMEKPSSRTLISSIQVLEVSTSPEPRDEEFSTDLAKGTDALGLFHATGSLPVNKGLHVLAKDLNELVGYTEKIGKSRKAEAMGAKASEANSETNADAQPTDYSYRAILATSLIFIVIIVACLWLKLLSRTS